MERGALSILPPSGKENRMLVSRRTILPRYEGPSEPRQPRIVRPVRVREGRFDGWGPKLF